VGIKHAKGGATQASRKKKQAAGGKKGAGVRGISGAREKIPEQGGRTETFREKEHDAGSGKES